MITIFLWVDGSTTLPAHSIEREVESRNAMCEECDGDGKVNRFRNECFTYSDFDGDEDRQDFLAENARGLYDIRCPCCNGNKIVKVPDLSNLSLEEIKQYEAQLEQDEWHEAERRAERRMGC